MGRLGLALNAMLDRLEEAFRQREASEARLRRFLADASHELRTPLASIRGYAELFRMGATADPAAIENAMRRIEEEAQRMGVLVEDLLALARLDRAPDREPERVDFAAAGGDAVADARAVAPDRTITLETDPEACVTGDPLQLRQVLANLLRNALTHTPAGHADRGVRVPDRERDHASASATTARDFRPTPPSSCSSASGEPRAGASGAAAGPGSGSRSRARSSSPTAARSTPARPPAAARSSWSACRPSGRPGRPRPRPPEPPCGRSSSGSPARP